MQLSHGVFEHLLLQPRCRLGCIFFARLPSPFFETLKNNWSNSCSLGVVAQGWALSTHSRCHRPLQSFWISVPRGCWRNDRLGLVMASHPADECPGPEWVIFLKSYRGPLTFSLFSRSWKPATEYVFYWWVRFLVHGFFQIMTRSTLIHSGQFLSSVGPNKQV